MRLLHDTSCNTLVSQNCNILHYSKISQVSDKNLKKQSNRLPDKEKNGQTHALPRAFTIRYFFRGMPSPTGLYGSRTKPPVGNTHNIKNNYICGTEGNTTWALFRRRKKNSKSNHRPPSFPTSSMDLPYFPKQKSTSIISVLQSCTSIYYLRSQVSPKKFVPEKNKNKKKRRAKVP